MRKTLVLSSALALIMATGAAYAGSSNTGIIVQDNNSNIGTITQSAGSNNVSKFTQDGTSNKATVTQNGDRNWASTHLETKNTTLDPNDSSGYNYMSQHGSDNQISILQTQNGNIVGVDGNVTQTGNQNVIDITQHGGASEGGYVSSVTQSASNYATSVTNKLTILQQGGAPDYPGDPAGHRVHYANEYIYSVKQTNTGGALNGLTLTQKGGNYLSPPNNKIVDVVQDGTGNAGSVMENGGLNYLASLSQTGTTNDSAITLNGSGNGSAGAAFGSQDASGVGIAQATAIQQGTGNSLTYTATGAGNLYGFSQISSASYTGYNTISGTVTDNDNQAAVSQAGNGNSTTFIQSGNTNDLGVAITGNNNGVGFFDNEYSNYGAAANVGIANGVVTQSGGTNSASITINDSNDNYGVRQTGGGNTVVASLTGSTYPYGSGENNLAISQAGDDTATVTMKGGNNVLGVQQLGAGGGNTLTANIFGNGNNWVSAFGGNAASLGLKPGSIYQNGSGDTITLNVGSDGSLSSNNLFAVKQTGGSGNTVTGTISGNYNQAAVLENGGGNTASFSQTGNYNQAIVRQ